MPNSTLGSLTAATVSTGGLLYGTQSGTDRKFTTTAAGAILMEAADAAAQVTALNALTSGGALGTPSSGTLTNCTFPTLNQNTTGSAATLTTARTINGTSFNGSANITVTAAGSTLSDTVPTTKGGTGLTALGTALQVLRTNAGATALEFATLPGGGNAQTADPLSQFAATTSAQLAGVISDETGSGALVFATSPTLVTPALGTPSSGNLASCTFPTLNQNTSGYAEALKSATTTVSVSAATAPTSGQVLTATSGTAATWQTPSGGGGGKVAQMVVAKTGTPTTTTVIIPFDNTIPQNTEGAEFITATITPTNASSKLIIEFSAWISASGVNAPIFAFFKDSDANAIYTTITRAEVADVTLSVSFRFVVDAGSTSAATYKLRFGPAVAGTICILRSNSTAAYFSTSDEATFTITEILP